MGERKVRRDVRCQVGKGETEGKYEQYILHQVGGWVVLYRHRATETVEKAQRVKGVEKSNVERDEMGEWRA